MSKLKQRVMSNVPDLFRKSFKYYKYKTPPPDFSRPLNFHSDNIVNYSNQIQKVNAQTGTTDTEEWAKYGLKPPSEWDAYTIKSNEGLIYIRNPYYNVGQRYWAVRCLRDFPKKPHRLNIDRHYSWSGLDDWWKACSHNDTPEEKEIRKSLRWTTLGYHHDWDTKVYTEEMRHEFPPDLGQKCTMIASCFGFKNFNPQASIVNYYHMDSTLAAHTDNSEKNLSAPLLSISFGQSDIFLIGGKTKDIEPTALYLHSGDIVIMSSESRLCYHAVPRIVPATSDFGNVESSNHYESTMFSNEYSDSQFWKPFADYLSNSRININVRQVLNDHEESLG